MLSPLSGFERYEEYHTRIQKELVGQTTSSGIHITGQATHFLERVFGTAKDPRTGLPRSGVEIEDVIDAVKNGFARPIRTDAETLARSQVFMNDKCMVAVNPDTGMLIQCNLR